MFGHLIKGEIVPSNDGKTSIFPDMNRAIEDPRILYALALREQGTLGRFAARYFSGALPEKSPEIRLLKDYIRTHGQPSASKEEIENIYYARYAIGGEREAASACDNFYPHLGGLKASGIYGGKYYYEILTYLKYRHFPT